MDPKFNKDLDISEIVYDPETHETLQSLDPTRLFSISFTDLLSVNSSFICIASDRSLTVCRSLSEDTKCFTFASSIKLMEISKISNTLALHLENQGFLIFDLEAEKEIFEYSQDQTIQIMKWNNWNSPKLGIYWADGVLELWSAVQSSFSSTHFEVKDLEYFEFLSPSLLILQTSDFKCKVMDLSESSIVLLDIKEEKIDKIISLDEDKIVVVYGESIAVYVISARTTMFVRNNKQIFGYDPISDYVYLANTGSLQVLVFTKDSFVAQRGQECLACFTLMEACSDFTIRKKEERPQAVVRHGEDLFLYTLKGEAIEEPLVEIKEELNLPKLKKKNKINNPIENFVKIEAKQINPKEITGPVIAALNKNFDEVLRKIEKTVSPHTVNTLVSKTIQSTFDSKLDGNTQKALVQNTITQALRFEFQTSLIPVVQQQLAESFGKITALFQESLKSASDYNNKSAAKAASLDTHMKNAIENITSTTCRIEKEYSNQLKKISETEVKLLESAEFRKQDEIVVSKASDTRIEALKRDIDLKLRSYDFEGAISRVLKENNSSYLYSVLNAINPKIFCSSRVMNESLVKQLFYQLIENIERDIEFKEIYVWVEELGKGMIIPSNEVSRLIVRLFELTERKPKMREAIKIFTTRLT